MVLIADNLAIAGRHLPLLEPTSLAVARGELLLVQAEPQPTRTALSLGLSARMLPTQGTVSWSGNPATRSVRLISALVDSPEINEPEAHLKVRDLVAEDLALQPGPIWRRSGINSWMKKHRMEDLANEWLDAIEPIQRLTLLTHLALEDRDIELLVFDSPDRHGIAEDQWFQYLESVATGRRAPAVVAVVQRIPEDWNGSTAYAGQVQQKLAAATALPPLGDLAAGLQAAAETPVGPLETAVGPTGEPAPQKPGNEQNETPHTAQPVEAEEPAPATGPEESSTAPNAPKELS
ncbi:MAG: ABC transporter ATP-binding protein [Micrococcaceae bacterium]|nr:ABC transporter ATP-binding protein [Micrococcaceae bacterium]